VEFDGEKSKIDLYALVLGINDYLKPDYKLNYAVNDANAFLEELQKGSDSLFNRVFTVELKDKLATKSELIAELKEISEDIGPEDVFVFYFAGHGVTTADSLGQNKFYLILQDVEQIFGNAQMLDNKAFSGEELVLWSSKIAAEKQLFVLDACQSGGILQGFASRGFEREKTLAQLARSSGTYFLTASEEQQSANEATELEHGFFTYSILEAMTGKSYPIAQDSKVTVNELKTYVEERVPELTRQYKTTMQYPNGFGYGQDFPLIFLK
jgi:uncharacterized caspase-like protein